MLQYCINLAKVSLRDVALVGGKAASLGEMLQMGVRVPGGFAVTVHAYARFVEANNLASRIETITKRIDVADTESLRCGGAAVRRLFTDSPFPEDVKSAIQNAYADLGGDVAVRSSGVAEDTAESSFAGQHETFLHISGLQSVLDAVRKCFASLYTDRAISYATPQPPAHSSSLCSSSSSSSLCSLSSLSSSSSLCVVVQRMVRSDLAQSGVAFSIDPDTGASDVVVINAAHGLGELVVGGEVVPDEFIIFKPTGALLRRSLGAKHERMVYDGASTARLPAGPEAAVTFCISNVRALEVAAAVVALEQHYLCPVDVEWAIDGEDGLLYIVQARPETVHSHYIHQSPHSFPSPHSSPHSPAPNSSSHPSHSSPSHCPSPSHFPSPSHSLPSMFVQYRFETPPPHEALLLNGIAVGDGVGVGVARVIMSIEDDGTFEDGDILVTDMTTPDWEPIMRRASAIVTNRGGRTCHAAIVAREMGLPAAVGCKLATETIIKGTKITVTCADGPVAHVYRGEHVAQRTVTEVSADDLRRVGVSVMLNIASPDAAARWRNLPVAGIGLARMEFIINNTIGVHPLALLAAAKEDPEIARRVYESGFGEGGGGAFFVERLAEGIAGIAAPFFPRPVIVRLSDFKSNEYRSLLGGAAFEPVEENPMIGWRGASRYTSEAFKPAFALECEALRVVRETMGLTNVIVMVPFVRTPEELRGVQREMASHGLVRGEKGLEIYMMAEVPSNFVTAERFAPLVDGFSIGSNDLTQLTLGIDRDSALVAPLYDERDPAVKAMITMLIEKAKCAGVKVGICGQGPSDFPDFAAFLVDAGIDSLSVTPDAVPTLIRSAPKNKSASTSSYK